MLLFQVEELEFFGKVIVIKHKKSKINRRAYSNVRLK